MNVSYRWLLDYVETDLSAEAVAAALTRIGLNVDSQAEVAGGDVCFDVEVTSNRPDCLGHLGVARELAAAIGSEVRLPDVACDESDEACDDVARVEVAELDLCPLYTARVIRGVKVGPSPSWLAGRLEAVGVRPVNNVVDVTNYVMMACGQPLHGFDYAGLAEHRIVVRRARDGEAFVAIDHSEHALTPERLVIADGKRAVALAGVMGGVNTEISGATTDVLLEAAVFDSLSIRNTARALGMASDSSYRFERGVDAGGTDWASRWACRVIAEVSGGRVARGVAVCGKPLPEPREVTLRVPRIETVLGVAVPAGTAAAVLEHLGLEIAEQGDERLVVRVPSRRADLGREVDLIEEVARHYGYDRIPDTAAMTATCPPVGRAERVRDAVSAVLVGAGYFEAVTFSFTDPAHASRFAAPGGPGEPLALRGTTLALRESVLPGLLESLRGNRNTGEADARLLEIAHRFIPAGEGLPDEQAMLALAGPDEFADVKGVLEAVFEALRLGGRVGFEAADGWPDLVPGEAAEVRLDGEPIGVLGRISRETAERFGLDEPPMVAEVVYERLAEAAELLPKYRPWPQVPPIVRDLAVVVDESVTWAALEAAVAKAGVEDLESVRLLDVYRGKQVAAGRKSVAVRLVLRRAGATLTHEDADGMQEAILGALRSSVGAELRG